MRQVVRAQMHTKTTIHPSQLPEWRLGEAPSGGKEGCGAKLIKVVLVARLEEGIPELAVKPTFDMGTRVGTLVIISAPSNSGPCEGKDV